MESQAGKRRQVRAAKAAPFVISFVAELIMAAMLGGIMLHIGIYTRAPA